MSKSYINKHLIILFWILSFTCFAYAHVSTHTPTGESIYSRIMPAETNQTGVKSELDSFLTQFSPVETHYVTNPDYISTSFNSHITYFFGDDAPALVSPSVNPSTAAPSTNFTYHVTYIDADSPLGVPKLYIKRGGAQISGSPFNMILESGTDPKEGLIYYYTKQLDVVSGEYTYYFYASDAFGSETTTEEFYGPSVNNPPMLSWVGSDGYTDDGVNSDSGFPEDTYSYRVVYSDTDNHPPKAGYPKLYIYNGTQSISGSPFTMQLYSGSSYTSGVVYEYSTTMPAGAVYSYKMECYDQLSDTYTLTGAGPDVYMNVNGYVKDPNIQPMENLEVTLTGVNSSSSSFTNSAGYYKFIITTETFKVSVNHDYYEFNPSSYTLNNTQNHQNNLDFTRLSRVPSLSYTGETNYVNRAVQSNTVSPALPMTFRITYSDPDGDAVKDLYPKLSIINEGTTVQTLIMNFDSGDYVSGAIFSTSTYVVVVGSYSYNVEVYDIYDEKSQSDLSGNFTVYILPPITPINSSIKAKNNSVVVSGSILISWECTATGNEILTYTLYLSDPQDAAYAPSFAAASNMKPIYTGTTSYYLITGLDPGKQYYWQVEAVNQYGASSIMPVQSFATLSDIQVTKAYNYPNPFNPALQEETNVVFNMEEDGYAEIKVYTEFGDLCWSQTFNNLSAGTNEITYKGLDDNGKMMYNGTYVCLIYKKYATRQQMDKCRLLIIK